MKNKTPDLSVEIGGIRMKNPVMTASGTFGHGPEYAELVDINRLGAVVVKGISLEPCEGNPTPRMVEVPGGLVNAIGLQNPGVDGFLKDDLPFLQNYDTPVLVNVWGKTEEAYGEIAARLSDVEGIAGLELNISCPNIKSGGIAFGTDPKTAARVISRARKNTKLPLIPKLSPNVSSIATFAKIAEDSGADAISLINTLPAMVIDIHTRRPVLANTVGGLSGPAIHPVAVKLIWEASRAVTIPVIGMGGITNAKTALECLIAGASAVAVGTATFLEPETALHVIKGIEQFLLEQGCSSVQDIIGSLQPPLSSGAS
jgi:dihydroorotate dehydrogenase (NAD+) catalytic subunit